MIAATVQKLPSVEPARANLRRTRRAFREGTAGGLWVGLEIMVVEPVAPQAAGSMGMTYEALIWTVKLDKAQVRGTMPERK